MKIQNTDDKKTWGYIAKTMQDFLGDNEDLISEGYQPVMQADIDRAIEFCNLAQSHDIPIADCACPIVSGSIQFTWSYRTVDFYHRYSTDVCNDRHLIDSFKTDTSSHKSIANQCEDMTYKCFNESDFHLAAIEIKESERLQQDQHPSIINYVIGDATYPQGEGNKIICHICNDSGYWGRGFVLALSKRWKEPEEMYRSEYRRLGTNRFNTGHFMQVQVEKGISVANMIAQKGVKSKSNPKPICYNSLDRCLNICAWNALASRSSVHMPRIGCGLAGGTWDEVEPLIQKNLCAKGIPVTVYDLQ